MAIYHRCEQMRIQSAAVAPLRQVGQWLIQARDRARSENFKICFHPCSSARPWSNPLFGPGMDVWSLIIEI